MSDDISAKDIIVGIGGGLIPFLPLELFGMGGYAIASGLVVGIASCVYSDEILAFLQKRIPALQDPEQLKKWLLSRAPLPEEGVEIDGKFDQYTDTPAPTSEPAENAIDAIFRMQREPVSTITMPRLLLNDIIRNTERDSYQICIGRSLTKNGNPPIWINFYMQHLKLIGASQYGKSSMAAAILYLITRTHTPEKVLIAMLDLEHKTSRLFADIPHRASVTIDGKQIVLHAKDRAQVLEHLAYIVAIMDERYKLSESEVEQEPILLVYLEEFLALKDFYKQSIDRSEGQAREQAKKNYAQLVFCVKEIARRGLKVKIQFLLCAQVDYRDEDFQEALVNITSGMSFCVLASAARAAGFSCTNLLNRNVEMNEKGVAVVETPDCKDLVHAVDFDVRKKLVKLAQAEAQRPREQRASILSPAQQSAPQDQGGPKPEGEQPPDAEARSQGENPNIRKLTYLHRRVLEHYQPGVGYRQLGELIGVGKDKAGDLIKELRNWGFLPNEPQ